MTKEREHGIGRLSRLTGVNVETIRYYERVSLLPSPPRTVGGHRSYSDEHRQRLVFIRRCRELGFTIDDIQNLLGLVEGESSCGDIREAALRHVAEIREKIADLKRMERTLTETAAQCEGGNAPDCPIVDILSDRDKPL